MARCARPTKRRCVSFATSSRGRGRLEAADVGCGDGRYDVLLFRYLKNLRLTCIDISSAMLEALSRHLGAQGIRDFKTMAASVEELDLRAESLDWRVHLQRRASFQFCGFSDQSRARAQAQGPDLHLHAHPGTERKIDLGPTVSRILRARAAALRPQCNDRVGGRARRTSGSSPPRPSAIRAGPVSNGC